MMGEIPMEFMEKKKYEMENGVWPESGPDTYSLDTEDVENAEATV